MSNNQNENLRCPFYSPVDDPDIFPGLEPGKVEKERSAKNASEGKIDKDTWTLCDYNSAPQDHHPFLLSRAASFGNNDFYRRSSPLNDEFSMAFRSPVKPSPCDMRRRFSDQLGTAPPLAGINSDASSSLDARQHLVQVDNHIDYTESESDAPPPSNNHYSDRNMSSRAADYPDNWEGAEGLISEMQSSGSTGSSVTSSRRGKRRRSSDRFDTASPIAASDSGTSSSPDVRQYMPLLAPELLENRENPGDSMLDNFSNSKKLKSGNRFSGSTGIPAKSSRRGKRRRYTQSFGTAPAIAAINSASSPDTRQHVFQENPPQLIPQVDDSDDFIENYTESEQSVPPNLDRNLPTTPSPDSSKENEIREKKKERDSRNQKKHYSKIKEKCKKAREEIPRLREEWEKLEKENQDQSNSLNEWQKREIVVISEGFEKQLDDAELSVKKLKTKPIKDDKMPANTYNNLVFRRKQNLVLEQQELEELRLKKQQDIRKKIRELTC